MNKQELINKYKELWNEHSHFYEPVPYTSMVELFLKDLKQLDEPQKVKVKKFVADWYEEHKDEFEYNVWDWLSSRSESGKIDSKFAFWLNDVDNTPIQTLVNMHQFGYEVEEEKKYFVKLKAVDQYLVSVKDEDFLGFLQSRLRSKFTRKELEDANLGWVFDCEGIEIEEVE